MQYAIGQIKILKDVLKNKEDLKLLIAVVLFMVMNTFKIALFNHCIIPEGDLLSFGYKLEITAFVFVLVYTVIFAVRNRVLFILFYIIQTVYTLAYISYYLYFRSYLHVMQWFTLFSEAFSAAENMAVPKTSQLLIAFIDLPCFVYILLKYFKIFDVRKRLKSLRHVLIIISVISLAFIEVVNYRADYSLVHFIDGRFAGESRIVQRYGTFINNIVGIYLNKSDKEMISRFSYGSDKYATGDSKDKPNFIMIQVESMDSNIVNKKYKGSYIMPFLHSYGEKNIYYPYVLSYHMGGGTSDSEFSIINSIEPIDGYPSMKISSYNHPNSFIKVFSNASYKTMAFHGNSGAFYNRDVAFPKMGFQEFFDMPKMNLTHIGWGAPDSEVLNYAYNTLKNQKQPFFSYIITMTSHGPFTNVKNYYSNENYSDVKNETVKNYFNSMSYVDREINEFVKKVKADMKNTYIFIWGDHTPGIKESEFHQASIDFSGRYLEFVPLIIITPDGKAYKEDKAIASFLDISPTVLKASGVRYGIKSDGMDLLDFKQNGKDVPYKDALFGRALLFHEISSKIKE